MSEAQLQAVQPIRLRTLLTAPRTSAKPRLTPQQERDLVHAAGRAAADADWRPRLEALAAELEAVRAEARSAEDVRTAQAADVADALQSALAAELATLALAIARQVLAAEPELPGATLESLVVEALSTAAPGDIGTLRVHPDAAACARLHLPTGWSLMADTGLSPGDVLAETGPCLALASLAHRLAQIRADLDMQP